MLFIPPPQFRKHRKPSRTPPTFHEGMTIQQVLFIGPPNIVLVATSQPLVYDGTSVPAAFMAMTSNGIMESCIAVPAHGTNFHPVAVPRERGDRSGLARGSVPRWHGRKPER